MKFIFADSLDFVDPRYDFLNDRNGEGRRPYWDDAYPHEIMGYAPYGGVLISRGIVGDHRVKGKYSEAQAMRFRRVGAREFLRLNDPKFASLDLFGDCGAFTYVKDTVPPYTPADTAEFYADCGFSHGCSVDHIIFDFDETLSGMMSVSPEAKRRYDITIENADAFYKETRALRNFTPLGVVQGWSPTSMAQAAKSLVAMGYDYLALGGMVPLKSDQIKACLAAIREVVPPQTRLHILGFAKANEIDTFGPFNITSFDTTSPLLRAFKDAKQNYFLRNESGKLDYFTAIRVPQAIENARLTRLVRQGDFRAEDLSRLEAESLRALRDFDAVGGDVEAVLEPVLEYNAIIATDRPYAEVRDTPTMKRLESAYRETLTSRPWKRCGCTICENAGIEVMIFRASNRNKRRGIHNLAVYKSLIDDLSAG